MDKWRWRRVLNDFNALQSFSSKEPPGNFYFFSALSPAILRFARLDLNNRVRSLAIEVIFVAVKELYPRQFTHFFLELTALPFASTATTFIFFLGQLSILETLFFTEFNFFSTLLKTSAFASLSILRPALFRISKDVLFPFLCTLIQEVF